MILRPYQHEAVAGCVACLREHKSTLVVLPTGAGKTIVFAKLADMARGRVMVLANRRMLVEQAAEKIKAVTGKEPSIEMADQRSHEHGSVFMRPKFVCSTVQSLSKRLHRFKPDDFTLVIIDEAHHAPADTYATCVQHFARAKLVGVTATPDRADKIALGNTFTSVAIDMTIVDAQDEGWLVPFSWFPVAVDDVDLSHAKLSGGGWDEDKVSEQLEDEGPLHQIATPVVGEQGDRPTLVFAQSIKQAERLAEIINRPENKPGTAACIHSEMPKDVVAATLGDMRRGKIQTLVNVDMATEGFDMPEIACVAIARPVKSRARYAQMLGRGTRPSPGVVDGPETADDRRAAIKSSVKPDLLVLDFDDASRDNDLVHPADVLAGERLDPRVRHKIAEMQRERKERDIRELTRLAQQKIREEDEELERAKQRSAVVFQPGYRRKALDHLRLMGADPIIGRTRADPLTAKQLDMLGRMGVDTASLTNAELRQTYGQVINRIRRGLCTIKQARLLSSFGYQTANVTKTEASAIIQRELARRRS